MPRPSNLTTIICGAIAALLGGFYVLGGLGVVPIRGHAGEGPIWLATCTGAVLASGGIAAILNTLPGPVPRRAIGMLSLAVVLGFALAAGWIALGPGHQGLLTSPALFGPETTDWGGRAAFGLGAVISALMAALIVHRALQARSSES